MKEITNDVQLLTKQLNDTKLVNKGILSEVEIGDPTSAIVGMWNLIAQVPEDLLMVTKVTWGN